MASIITDLIVRLFDIEAVKFGNFTLKSGIQSPIYFDLRVIISYPDVMVQVSELLWKAAKNSSVPYVSVCGVPYTALPLATCISANHGIPMLIRRKEAKSYGTKKIIEGHFKAGDVCLIVEDVVTTGSSVLETFDALKADGLAVTDAVVLLDREQGGRANLAAAGISLHSVIGITELLECLLNAQKISGSTVESVKAFLAENQQPVVQSVAKTSVDNNAGVVSYRERAELCSHPMVRRLFEIMEAKKTNLSLSVDVFMSKQLLDLADQVGPYICVLKTHVDILKDFTPEIIKSLKKLATTHNFLIFEDRKFADIGSTVCEQYGGGIYEISRWADIVNAHGIPGPGILRAIKQANPSAACLLVAEMSSEGNLITPEYTKESLALAETHRDTVVGFIATRRITDDPNFVHMTPGVHLASTGDGLGQQYVTPREVIVERRSDVIIVGRGIVRASHPVEAAMRYRDAGYEAYCSLFENK